MTHPVPPLQHTHLLHAFTLPLQVPPLAASSANENPYILCCQHHPYVRRCYLTSAAAAAATAAADATADVSADDATADVAADAMLLLLLLQHYYCFEFFIQQSSF